MTIPKNINKAHIVEAIHNIDREGVPDRRESTRFNLSYEGEKYPPKYVISIANIFANGEEYSSSFFNGGDETNKFLSELGFTITLESEEFIDLEPIVNSNPEAVEPSITEKEQIIKSRVGQSTFKKELLEREKKCGLCGVSHKSFLIASHIKPWCDSTSQERLDVNNGLLLCPNHDALFDNGYISFDESGIIIISNELDEETKIFLNINETMKIELREDQKKYMKWHRKKVFNLNQKCY